MPRRPYHPLALLAATLALPLCLVQPILADAIADGSSDADSVAETSLHAAEARSQREVFATVGAGFTIGFDVELFEAGLPHDISTRALEDQAAASPAAAPSDGTEPALRSPDFDVALFEAGLPPEIAAPLDDQAAIPALVTAGANEGETTRQSAARSAVADFDVALFEAGLPRDRPNASKADPAIATPLALRAHPRAVPSKPAAAHPRNGTPAVKQPLRSAAARGKPNDPARTASPTARKAAAAPPATIPGSRPRAGKPDHGPRELFIARLPPVERDEVMPALRPVPVTRASLPPPALALK
jgi:hypothetical protein